MIALEEARYIGKDNPERHSRLLSARVPTVLAWGSDAPELLDGKPEGLYIAKGACAFGRLPNRIYIRWLEELCQNVHGVHLRVVQNNPSAWKGKALFELFISSHCKRCIGPETSRKLACYFTRFAGTSKPLAEGDPIYSWLWRVTTLASNDGLLWF
jgi:hypothetical protein